MPRRLLPLAFAVGAALVLATGCGDDDGSAATRAATTTGRSSTTPTSSASGPSTTLALPASRFSLNQDEIGSGFITQIPNTFVLDATTYAASPAFDSKTDGAAKLGDWGYLGGYETGYVPEGRNAALLNGGYEVVIESHIFKDEDGTKKAFDYISARVKNAGASQVSAPQVGSQSVAYLKLAGKLPGSNIDRAIHQIIMRRGNLLVILATGGAQPFMKVDTVAALGGIVDQKAIGKRPLVEPTPTSNYTPPVFPARTATAAPTQGR